MPTRQSQVESIAHTRIGKNGQLTIPKQCRDEVGLEPGAPVAVLRIGGALMLIPEQPQFQALCESISSLLERRNIAASDLIDGLPAARERVFARRYRGLTRQGKRR